MTKFDLMIGVLAGLSIISLVVLSVLKIDVSVLVTVIGALLGYLVGVKKDVIVGAFKK